jgi:hypothetical protein
MSQETSKKTGAKAETKAVPFSADFSNILEFKYANAVGTTTTPHDIRILFADVHPNEGKGIKTDPVFSVALSPECAISLLANLQLALQQYSQLYMNQRLKMWEAIPKLIEK